MRFGILFATATSLIVHALMFWLMPTPSPPRDAALKAPASPLQARLLPAPSELPKPAISLETANPSAAPQADTALRRSQKSPVLATTTTLLPAHLPSNISQPAQPAPSYTPSLGTAHAQPATPSVASRNAPLDLTVRVDKTPPRSALQEAVQQQAIRPDAMARSFERALEQTAPLMTEITQTVDATGKATVKVRTPGGTYCLVNNTPPGATLYDLKPLAGNCPR